MKHRVLIYVVVALLVVVVYVKIAATPSETTLARLKTSIVDECARADAREFGLPYIRIAGMICVESAGNPSKPGAAGERGPMQMTQAALSDVNRKYNLGYTWDDMLDMQKGTRAGAAYLALLLDEYFPGDIDKATRAYNSGMGNVKWNPLAGQVYLLKVKSYESINS